jgi:hypothetical protein
MKGVSIDWKLIEISKHWELEIEVGNDWGEPPYIETRKYETREDLDEALVYQSYYDIVLSIKEVVEYDRIWNWEKEEEN